MRKNEEAGRTEREREKGKESENRVSAFREKISARARQ